MGETLASGKGRITSKDGSNGSGTDGSGGSGTGACVEGE